VDQTGAPIPNATLKLQGAAHNAITPVVRSDHDGTFVFSVAPKKYELTVESAGFQTNVKTIDVGTDKDFKIGDIVMSVANFGGLLVEAVRTLVVQGINGTSATLSVSDLSKLPQQTVKATDHGTPAKFHSTAASYHLLVEAKDGYRAVFAWAELDSTFMDKAVYVVTEWDGKPLSDKDGPFQLVVPGEKRGARWVRQVTALRIRQGN